MSKTQSIIDWFAECGLVEDIIEFDVNQLAAKDDAAGLYKQPAVTREKLIDGSEIVTENYYLLFRRAAQLKADRISNDDFLEQVEDWLVDQEFAENYPDIGYPVYEVSISNSFYMLERDTNEAIYQLSISIKYERRR